MARMPEFNEAVDNLPQNDWFDDSRSLVTATSFLFVFVIIVSLFSLSLSIGLLNRKWWARIPFIGEMVLWALLAVYVLQVQIRACIHMPDKYTFPFNVPGPGIIFTIGGGIFCIWVIKCLLSRQVASEFRRG
ncbi:hypothetical protein LJC47_02940 [Desulfosarcina sp. OttesenSCG-928-B08]|nr:hypothetical protein [Desulfosarcina sp. OttesenSCG-928-B08]